MNISDFFSKYVNLQDKQQIISLKYISFLKIQYRIILKIYYWNINIIYFIDLKNILRKYHSKKKEKHNFLDQMS